MNKKAFNKVSILLLTICLFLSLVGCGKQEEPIEQVEEAKPVQETAQVPQSIEPVVEIVDDDIEGIENLIKANSHLNFEAVDKDKYYSLEEITVYLMNLFRLSEDAINKNYQCPFDSVNKENKPLIAYAYANRMLAGVNDDDLTNAESENIINNVSSLLLSLMGYSSDGDKKDYEEDKAVDFLKTLGVEIKTNTGKIRGDYLAKLTNDMLEKTCKNGETVKDTLEKAGVFKEKIYQESTYLAKGEEIPKAKQTSTPKTNNTASSNTESSNIVYNDSSSSGSSDSGTSSGGNSDSGSSTGGGGGGDVNPPVNPWPINPPHTDPEPVDPTPVDPTPVDPTPVDPTPVDPGTGGGGGENELPPVDF